MFNAFQCPTRAHSWGLVLLPVLAAAFPSADGIATPSQFHAELHSFENEGFLSDHLSTPIDVSGEHAFQPPNFEQGDQRGPCPGLNALANHGYLSRDGVVGFTEVIDAVHTVYGMGLDIATILSAMGTVTVGNPLSLHPGFSIGGETPKSNNLLGNLGGLVGTPRGLDGSHNLIESDSSATRNDLYVTGNASTLDMSLFDEFYSAFGDKTALSMDNIGDYAAKRMKESIATNPDFYYGPFTGLISRNAGYAFAGRLLSNHSADSPQGGHLTKDVLKSFWGISGSEEEEGSFPLTYRRGWERIPENWYRTPVDYNLVALNLDIVTWVGQHPEMGSIGGNMGQVNTFAGVDLTNVTGGVSMLDGSYLVCFALQFVKTFAPNSLSPLFKTLEPALEILTGALADGISGAECPAMGDLSAGGESLLDVLGKFPGVKKSGFAF